MPQSDEYLKKAIAVQHDYSTAHLVTDEAELLRGCLAALVAIAQILYGGAPD